MFQTAVVAKIKTGVLFTIKFFFFKIKPFWENSEKYGRDRQDTGDNIIGLTRLSCRIITAEERDTVIIFNTSYFYMATVVTRNRFTLLYIACLVKFSVMYGNVSTESCIICHIEVTCNVHYFYYLLYQTYVRPYTLHRNNVLI